MRVVTRKLYAQLAALCSLFFGFVALIAMSAGALTAWQALVLIPAAIGFGVVFATILWGASTLIERYEERQAEKYDERLSR